VFHVHQQPADDLFERQIYATFQDDHVAMSLIPFLGILAR
jgi:hypothetical protein